MFEPLSRLLETNRLNPQILKAKSAKHPKPQTLTVVKAADIANTLTKMKDKGDLNEKQQAFVQRKNSLFNINGGLKGAED